MKLDRVPIEFIGLKLPGSNPTMSFQRLTRRLTPKEAKMMNDIDASLVSMCVIQGAKSAYRLGTADGLSQAYEWSWQNQYTQNVVASDARIILERMVERRCFKRLDDPRDAKRTAEYPSPTLIALVQVTRGAKQHRLDQKHARFIRRMRGVARGDINPTVLGQRIMRYEGPNGERN